MSEWLTLFLALGATVRLVRLVVIDDAGVVVRMPVTLFACAALGRERGARFAAALLSCPFCIGFWIALAVCASWGAWAQTTWWQVGAGTLTASYVAGHLVSTLDDDLEE